MLIVHLCVIVLSLVIGSFLNFQMLKHKVYDVVTENAAQKQVLINLHDGKKTYICTMATAVGQLLKKTFESPQELSEEEKQAEVNPLHMHMCIQ